MPHKTLRTDKNLKVKGYGQIKGHLKVNHHLEVDGHLNFGDRAVTQLTSNTTGVTCNSASGVITMFAPVNTTSSFIVTNDKVKASSVILVSFMSFVRFAPILSISDVSDGFFTINVDVATGTTITPVISFLVC